MSESQTKGHVYSSGATQGLTKLFNHYSATVFLDQNSQYGRYYELVGREHGVDEVRKIIFKENGLPEILEFVDSEVKRGLKVQKTIDYRRTDPLTVFLWFYSSDFSNSGCKRDFSVFDGKKRFQVKVSSPFIVKNVEIQELEAKLERVSSDKLNLLECRLTFVWEDSNRSVEDKSFYGFWPFNKAEQIIDLQIDGVSIGKPFINRIVIYTPIGKIIGRLKT